MSREPPIHGPTIGRKKPRPDGRNRRVGDTGLHGHGADRLVVIALSYMVAADFYGEWWAV